MPVIECPEAVESGERFELKVSVGKEITHPNTTEHHIRWIQVFFQPEGEQYSHELVNCEFTAHGESVKGANQDPVYSEPMASTTAMINKPGTIYVLGMCNIHGLWQNSKEMRVG